MNFRSAIMLTILCTCSLSAQGEDSTEYDIPFQYSTSEINKQINLEATKADSELDLEIRTVLSTFKKLKSEAVTLPDSALAESYDRVIASFVKSQKKWFYYRDAELNFMFELSGGSSRYAEVMSRRLELTNERLNYLRQFLEPYDK